MTDYAIMPLTDYQNICDSVRAKTGGTEVLKSGDLPSAIEGIETGTVGIPFDSVSSFIYYPAGQYPDGNFVGSFPHATSLSFPNSKLTSIDVTVTSSLLSFSLQPNGYSVKEVTIRGDMSGVKNCIAHLQPLDFLLELITYKKYMDWISQALLMPLEFLLEHLV